MRVPLLIILGAMLMVVGIRVPTLPRAVGSWKLLSTEHYTPQTLYDYMDGGAELYLSYGFQELTVGRYSQKDRGDLVAEIYRMDNSANAFGIFAHYRQGDSLGVGQDSELTDGWLRFWKADYYVSIYAEETDAEADSAIRHLARAIERQIPRTGARPEILGLLPQEGLLSRSVRYFHDHVALNHYCFLHRENILGLSRETEGCLARYQNGEEKAVLVLIRFRTAEAASQAVDRFYAEYLRSAAPGNWAEVTGGWWGRAQAVGPMLLMIPECSRPAYGDPLLQKVKALCQREVAR
jgi:hypothetical protein